jgi:hypothetical protein
MSNTILNQDLALDLLEQVRNQVESKFYLLRDDILDSDQLSDIRHELRDACDILMEVTRLVERLEREVENTHELSVG